MVVTRCVRNYLTNTSGPRRRARARGGSRGRRRDRQRLVILI